MFFCTKLYYCYSASVVSLPCTFGSLRGIMQARPLYAQNNAVQQ